jgi:hypothetical protein
MGVFYHKEPIVTNGLTFSVDSVNLRSYDSGSAPNDVVNLTNFTATGSLKNGTGYTNEVWEFDGTDDYIDFGKPTKSDEVTIDIWAKWGPLPTDTGGNILFSYATTSTNGWSIFGPAGVAGGDYNYWSIYVQTSAGTQFIQPSVAELYPDVWYNITITLDSSSLNFYLNGSLSQSKSSTGTISYNGSANLQLGKWTGGSSYFEGSVANAKVYNRALSASEVLQNYNTSKSRFGIK